MFLLGPKDERVCNICQCQTTFLRSEKESIFFSSKEACHKSWRVHNFLLLLHTLRGPRRLGLRGVIPQGQHTQKILNSLPSIHPSQLRQFGRTKLKMGFCPMIRTRYCHEKKFYPRRVTEVKCNLHWTLYWVIQEKRDLVTGTHWRNHDIKTPPCQAWCALSCKYVRNCCIYRFGVGIYSFVSLRPWGTTNDIRNNFLRAQTFLKAEDLGHGLLLEKPQGTERDRNLKKKKKRKLCFLARNRRECPELMLKHTSRLYCSGRVECSLTFSFLLRRMWKEGYWVKARKAKQSKKQSLFLTWHSVSNW